MPVQMLEPSLPFLFFLGGKDCTAAFTQGISLVTT